jgi:hypothetical protein
MSFGSIIVYSLDTHRIIHTRDFKVFQHIMPSPTYNPASGNGHRQDAAISYDLDTDNHAPVQPDDTNELVVSLDEDDSFQFNDYNDDDDLAMVEPIAGDNVDNTVNLQGAQAPALQAATARSRHARKAHNKPRATWDSNDGIMARSSELGGGASTKTYRQAMLTIQPDVTLNMPPDLPTPNNFGEYNSMPEHYKRWWRVAVEKEWAAFIEKDAFSPVPIYVAKASTPRIMTTRWVLKRKADGTPKARLVIRGFQEPNLNKDSTYAPTVSHPGVRLVHLVGLSKGWEPIQADWSNSFLNGDVEHDEHLYVYPPEGVSAPGMALQLTSSVYGLASSPVRWNIKLSADLIKFGLKQSAFDPCVYFNDSMVACLWVDDYKGFGLPAENARFRNYMNSRYKLTYSQSGGEFVSISFDNNSDCIEVHQERYIRSVVKDLCLEDAHDAIIPLPVQAKDSTSNDGQATDEDISSFRTGLGKINYALSTRLDVAYAFHFLSQFSRNPSSEHIAFLDQVIRYLKATPRSGYKVVKSSLPVRVNGFVDSNFARDIEDRKSTGGFVILAHNTPIQWRSKKQTLVASSSTHAEGISLNDGAEAVMDQRCAYQSLGVLAPGPAVLYCDNQPVIDLVQRGDRVTVRGLPRHVAIRLLKVREYIEQGDIVLRHVPTELNIADILTKANPAPVLRMHLERLDQGKLYDFDRQY